MQPPIIGPVHLRTENGRTARLEAHQTLWFGRDEAADLSFPDDRFQLSREAGEIVHRGDAVSVTNLSSNHPLQVIFAGQRRMPLHSREGDRPSAVVWSPPARRGAARTAAGPALPAGDRSSCSSPRPEHRQATALERGRQLRGEPGLADTRVPGQHQTPRRRARQQVTEPRHLVLAPDERPVGHHGDHYL